MKKNDKFLSPWSYRSMAANIKKINEPADSLNRDRVNPEYDPINTYAFWDKLGLSTFLSLLMNNLRNIVYLYNSQ